MTGDERDEQRKLAEAQLGKIRELLDRLQGFGPTGEQIIHRPPRSSSQIREEFDHVSQCIASLTARANLDWLDEITLEVYRRRWRQLTAEDLETLVSHRLEVAVALDCESVAIGCRCAAGFFVAGPMKEAFEMARRHVEQRP